ncbi:TPA: protein YgfX [Neisseria oralis]
MRAFQTALKPSRTLLRAAVLLHLAAVAACLAWFYGWMMWAGLAALAASFAHALRVQRFRYRNAVRRIEVDRLQQATVCIDGGQTCLSAVLCDESVVSRHAMFLTWDTGGRKIRHLVLPDMTTREEYRLLSVWARWCRSGEGRPSETAEP